MTHQLHPQQSCLAGTVCKSLSLSLSLCSAGTLRAVTVDWPPAASDAASHHLAIVHSRDWKVGLGMSDHCCGRWS